MISNNELAKKWNVSDEAVDKIIAFADKHHLHPLRACQIYKRVNQLFAPTVIKNPNAQKYHGAIEMYTFQERSVKTVAMSPACNTPLEAIRFVNEDIRTKKFNWAMCYKLGLLPEARQLITPFNEKEFEQRQKSIAISALSRTRGGRSE